MIQQVLRKDTPHGEIVVYRITNKVGASIELSNVGAGITSVIVPDKNGSMDDVILGYNNHADYIGDGACFGKIPGRYANRVAKGEFSIDGKNFKLNINNGPNHLHGGPSGFANRLWNSHVDDNKVVFTLQSGNGDENYPGNMKVTAVYSWSDDCTISLSLSAISDAPTIVNLTNHAYWNLSGENSGSIFNHELKLNAVKYLPTDDTLIPTGELANVKGTPMDFTDWKRIGADIEADFPALKYGKGYDNCWVVDDYVFGKVQKVAELYCPVSGRLLEVLSNQPGVQVYTGNWLAGSPKSKSGRSYNDYDGVAIECQGFPDAPNKANFPSQVLRPGEIYERVIEFKFGVK